jgi:hypothetical protein
VIAHTPIKAMIAATKPPRKLPIFIPRLSTQNDMPELRQVKGFSRLRSAARGWDNPVTSFCSVRKSSLETSHVE